MAEALNGKETKELTRTASQEPSFVYGGGSQDSRTISSRDKLLRIEGHGRLSVYRDLQRDAKVEATLNKRYAMTVNTPTLVKPGLRRGLSERRIDRKAADMVNYQIEAMGVTIDDPGLFAIAKFDTTFDGMCRGLLEAILLGYAVGEIIWGVDGSETYVSEVKIRLQEWFKFDILGRLRYFEGISSFGEGKTLPSRKMLVYTLGSHTDPYGLGLGNRLFWPVSFKRKDLSFWIRFLDKYGGPTAVGKYPASSQHDEKQQKLLLDAVKSIQSETGVIIPDGMEIELLMAITTAAQQGFDQMAKYLDGQIAQTVLGVTLTTEIGNVGSRAATETHAEQQSDIGEEDSKTLCNFLTATLSRWITDYNFGGEVPAPRLIKPFVNLTHLGDQANIDSKLFSMGYRRTMESVNTVYGSGDEVYEKVEPGKAAGRKENTSTDVQPTDTVNQNGRERDESSAEGE